MKGRIFFFFKLSFPPRKSVRSKNVILSLGHVRLDFLKVLCFSFPVPVVDLSLVCRRKHKKSPAHISCSRKILSSTCGHA